MALTKIIHNCETGVTEEVELTPQEIAEIESAREEAEAEQAARETAIAAKAALKASAKAKLLAGQPLTEDEADVLLG
jgi:hypothetical protein